MMAAPALCEFGLSSPPCPRSSSPPSSLTPSLPSAILFSFRCSSRPALSSLPSLFLYAFIAPAFSSACHSLPPAAVFSLRPLVPHRLPRYPLYFSTLETTHPHLSAAAYLYAATSSCTNRLSGRRMYSWGWEIRILLHPSVKICC